LALNPNISEATARADGETLWVMLQGELDIATAIEFGEILRQAERRAPRRLVLDLSALRFIDASGLRIILTAARRARACERRFAVANPPPMIARLFQLTAIDQTVSIVTERRTAMSTL
jgi:anti-anti-sigma factor